MAVNSSEECQNVHSVVLLPDGGMMNPQNEALSDVVGNMDAPDTRKTTTCSTTESVVQTHTNFKIDIVDKYVPRTLDADIEKGQVDISEANDVPLWNLKPEYLLGRVLQREIYLQVGGRFMQFLLNHVPDLPKFTSGVTERFHDTPTNRARKYKRSASFNSRRVVLLFSILSSMGTIILIYLTLRVRQIADNYGNA